MATKIPLTVSIDKPIIDHINKLVKSRVYRNKSHVVENAIILLVNMHANQQKKECEIQ